MTFPKTSILDNFKRADAVNLGPNYTVVAGYNGLGIVANHATLVYSPAFQVWSRRRYAINQQVWIVTNADLPESHLVWLAFRCNSSQPTDGYKCTIGLEEGTLRARLVRISTGQEIGSPVDLGVAAFSTGDLFGIDATGYRFTLYYRPVGGAVSGVGQWYDTGIATPGYIGLGATNDLFTLIATTAGAQTVKIFGFTPDVDVQINWGDGNFNTINAGNVAAVTHDYAGAGVWTITITNASRITYFGLDDNKIGCTSGQIGKLTAVAELGFYNTTSIVVSAGEIGKLLHLKYLDIYGITTFTVEAGEIGNLILLLVLRLSDCPNVTISSGEIGGLMLLYYLAIENSPNVSITGGEIGGLTQMLYLRLATAVGVQLDLDEIGSLGLLKSAYMTDSAGIALQTDLPSRFNTVTYRNNLTQGQVDAVLQQAYVDRVRFIHSAPRLYIDGGGNAAPSGVYQDANPPTTGKEFAFKLENDPDGEGFNKWVITYS